jgi:hypothetical protein
MNSNLCKYLYTVFFDKKVKIIKLLTWIQICVNICTVFFDKKVKIIKLLTWIQICVNTCTLFSLTKKLK